jgi:altronate hydrolase
LRASPSTTLRPVRVIRLNAADDVVIALEQLISGTVLDGEAVTVSGLIPPGYKMATRDIGQGQAAHRYGQITADPRGAARSHP